MKDPRYNTIQNIDDIDPTLVNKALLRFIKIYKRKRWSWPTGVIKVKPKKILSTRWPSTKPSLQKNNISGAILENVILLTGGMAFSIFRL